MTTFDDWAEVLPQLLRDARFRAELIDRLEDDGERLVNACLTGKALSPDEAETLHEELCETYSFFAERVVCLDWDSCSPMGSSGASWVDGFAGVYWFGSSDWEGQGPFDSVDGALSASSSFDMATYDASLRSDALGEADLLRMAASICPHDGEIYVNGTAYRHGDDGLVANDS
jgi:hypothetical protein